MSTIKPFEVEYNLHKDKSFVADGFVTKEEAESHIDALKKQGYFPRRNYPSRYLTEEGAWLLVSFDMEQSGVEAEYVDYETERYVKVFGFGKREEPESLYEMLRQMIKQATKRGEAVLDLFGGSGVTLSAALELGRKAHIVEKCLSAIETFIAPRLEAFVCSRRVGFQTSIYDFGV